MTLVNINIRFQNCRQHRIFFLKVILTKVNKFDFTYPSYITFKQFFHRMFEQNPIKQRIAELKQHIETIRAQNAQTKKVLDITEKQFKVLESKLQDPFNVIKDYFAVATVNLNSNYEKECLLYEEQVQFLQQQINAMTDDKVKATQSCLILQEKIRNLSEDIGV